MWLSVFTTISFIIRVMPLKRFLRFSCNHFKKASLLWLKWRKLPKALSLEVEVRLWLWFRRWQSVFGGTQHCHNIIWLSLTQNEQDAKLPWKRSWAHTVKEWQQAAVPPLFKCKYLTELINGYTINMDPLKGAGASVLPHGPKGHRVTSKKSFVDPLDHYWFNLAISNSIPPQTNAFSHSRSLLDCQPLPATVTSAAGSRKRPAVFQSKNTLSFAEPDALAWFGQLMYTTITMETAAFHTLKINHSLNL